MTRSRHAPGRALALMSAAALVLLPGTALGADSILWTNSSGAVISSAAVDGSGGFDLPLVPGASYGIAVDSATGRIYWAENDGGGSSIRVASLDGGPSTALNTGQASIGFPDGVAVDPAGGRVYWANPTKNAISFANLDGGGRDLPTGAATVKEPVGVAVDPAGGRVYWANEFGDTISFANLDPANPGGGNIPTGRATVDEPQGVAIDPSTKRIYWANSGPDAGSIAYASLDPDHPGGADVFTGFKATLATPEGVAIDPVAGRIYWANDESKQQISYTSLDDNGDDADLNIAGANSQGVPSSGASLPILLVAPHAVAPPAVAGGAAVGSAL